MPTSVDGSGVTVSCVMIFLDAADFIEESIRSVVDQTYSSWELILVDDGSSDASTAIARRWARSDPRVRYVDHDGHANLGMSASRNRGIAESRGRLVAFLDSDDIWMPSALSHRTRVIDALPTVDALIGGTWRWYSWLSDGDSERDEKMGLPPALPRLQPVDPVDAFVGVYASPEVWYVPAMCSIVIRRDKLLELGGMSDEFVGLYEDQVLYAKVLLGLRVVFDDRALSLYRQHDASACAAAIRIGEWRPHGASTARDRFLTWLAAYVESQDCDPEIGRLVEMHRQFWVGALPDEATSMAGPGSYPSVGAPIDDPATVRPSAIAARARRFGGLAKRRARLLLGRRGDVRWLIDLWTSEHVSAWPTSSVRVIVTRRYRWLMVRSQLRRLRTQADNERVIATLVPARRPGSSLIRMPWPTATTLARDARRTFPESTVTVEPFGNDVIRRALGVGAAVGDIPRIELDRHDPAAPLVLALTIENRRSPSDPVGASSLGYGDRPDRDARA